MSILAKYAAQKGVLDGLKAIPRIRDSSPETKIVVLSVAVELVVARRAVDGVVAGLAVDEVSGAGVVGSDVRQNAGEGAHPAVRYHAGELCLRCRPRLRATGSGF